MTIWDIEYDWEQRIEYFPILEEFKDGFPNKILGLPPEWDLEFSIELTLGLVSDPKAPYCMSATELVELKLQL